ncbi:hypothetical protein GF324_11715, partial [bacterium]|nr:hypothetical protein [bacterium]
TAWAWMLWGILVVLAGWGVWHLSMIREQRRREQLEELVRKRTEELAEALAHEREAEIKAKQMETAYRMAATLAHEFNNPLAVIMTSLEVALTKKDGSEDRERLLKKIPPQVERMTGLIQEMLKIEDLREIDYASGMKILDLHGSSKDDSTSTQTDTDQDSD